MFVVWDLNDLKIKYEIIFAGNFLYPKRHIVNFYPDGANPPRYCFGVYKYQPRLAFLAYSCYSIDS